jgi:hypothetical protein
LNIIEKGPNICHEGLVRKTYLAAFFLFALALALTAWAFGYAAAQNQEDSPLFSGIVLEEVPAAPTDLTVVSVSENQITISWRDNSSNETKFEIWRAVFSSDLRLRTEVGDNVTTYTDSGLESGTTYSYMVKACNDDGCSDSNVVSATTSGTSDDYVNVSCFIATAVYRDALHPDVQALREFRDRYLMTNPVGRAFVDLYYRYSPPAADYISSHEFLRRPLRAAFIPIALSARHPVAALVVFAGAIIAGAVIIRRKKFIIFS